MPRYQQLGIGLLEGLLLLALVHWLGLWWVIIVGLAIWWWQGRGFDPIDRAALAMAIISLVLELALNPHLLAGTVLVLGYWAWRGSGQINLPAKYRMVRAGWLQYMALATAFTAEAVWHWPTIFVLLYGYSSSWVVAKGFLATAERAANALAATWALVVAEISLIFSIWLVHYVLPGSWLIPQGAIVITALGYCFGSIYLAHASSKLSRARLAEYAIIGLCLIVIVIAGTKWSGSV